MITLHTSKVQNTMNKYMQFVLNILMDFYLWMHMVAEFEIHIPFFGFIRGETFGV